MSKKKPASPFWDALTDGEFQMIEAIRSSLKEELIRDTPAPDINDPVDFSLYFLTVNIGQTIEPEDIPDNLLDAWIAKDSGPGLSLPGEITPESLPYEVFVRRQALEDEIYEELNGVNYCTPDNEAAENFRRLQIILRTIRETRQCSFRMLRFPVFDFDRYPEIMPRVEEFARILSRDDALLTVSGELMQRAVAHWRRACGQGGYSALLSPLKKRGPLVN